MRPNHSCRRLVAAAAGAVMLFAACSDSAQVGSKVGGAGGSGEGALRDPSATTTTIALADLVAPSTARPTGGDDDTASNPRSASIGDDDETPVTQAPVKEEPETPATTQPAPQNLIKIPDAECFDPLQYQVPLGATVVWKNTGTKPRKVVAEPGSDGSRAFVSPDIGPGASFTWVANVSTQVITYGDSTRPYCNKSGKLQVY